MIWIPLVLLRATPAYLPAPQIARMAICDLDGGAPDAGAPDAGGSDSGSSGSNGSSGSAGSSGSSGTTASAGSTGGVLGNTTSDNGDSQDFGAPSSCNTTNDCPNLFECSAHKCRPLPQNNVDAGGCASAPGLGWSAALVAFGAILLRRRRT